MEDWEDWENDDFIPVLPSKTSEQLKALEEKRLIEESETALAKDLFSNEKTKLFEEKIINQPIAKKNKKNLVNNNKINELKQKEISMRNKEAKKKKQKHLEAFGENDYYDEYGDFEDKIYNSL